MLDRPSRFNAFNDELYRAFPLALKEAGEDWPRTKVTLLTGNTSSPWYSSGNDLTDFLARFNNASDMKQVIILSDPFSGGLNVNQKSINDLITLRPNNVIIDSRPQRKWAVSFRNL